MVLIIVIFSCLYYTQVQSQCLTPPLVCPNENVTFWLYTRSNANAPHQLVVNDANSLQSAPWVKNSTLKIVIHGFGDSINTTIILSLVQAFLNKSDENVISVDYSPLSKVPCYPQAARNTELVGKCTEQLICILVNNYSMPLSNINLVGYSLGAHVSGYTAKTMTCGKLAKLYAIEPPMLLFEPEIYKPVNANDADFVVGFHTSILSIPNPVGHVDCYANALNLQPGCPLLSLQQTNVGCAHQIAMKYFTESVYDQNGFCSAKCNTWLDCKIGIGLDSTNKIPCGYYVPTNASGPYHFATKAAAPYSQSSCN